MEEILTITKHSFGIRGLKAKSSDGAGIGTGRETVYHVLLAVDDDALHHFP